MNEQKATPINQPGSLCAPGIGEVWCGVTSTVSPSPVKNLSWHFNKAHINRTDWGCVCTCVFCFYQAQMSSQVGQNPWRKTYFHEGV